MPSSICPPRPYAALLALVFACSFDSSSAGGDTTFADGGPGSSSSSTGEGTTAIDSSTGTTDVTGDGAGTPDDPQGCCEVHDAPGCNEAAVQSCVCDQAPACCAFGWDAACVDRASVACEATCMADASSDGGVADSTGTASAGDASDGGGDTGGPPSSNDGPCCEGSELGAGCGDARVAACVCAGDPYCCDTNWDLYCVAEASACGIDCMNDCCAAHEAQACNDIDVFGCVTDMLDSCWAQWTAECVDAATMQCGLTCM